VVHNLLSVISRAIVTMFQSSLLFLFGNIVLFCDDCKCSFFGLEIQTFGSFPEMMINGQT
jgi:hypothetical protein